MPEVHTSLKFLGEVVSKKVFRTVISLSNLFVFFTVVGILQMIKLLLRESQMSIADSSGTRRLTKYYRPFQNFQEY